MAVARVCVNTYVRALWQIEDQKVVPVDPLDPSLLQLQLDLA